MAQVNLQESKNPNPRPRRDEEEDDEEMGKEALKLAFLGGLPMALKSAIELGLIDTLHAGGGELLSPSDLSLRLPSVRANPDAPVILDRLLRLLASFGVVECRTVQTGRKVEREYRAGPVCRFLLKNGEKGSFGPLLLLAHDFFSISVWSHLNEAILEGGTRAFGDMSVFEYLAGDERLSRVFNTAMSSCSMLVMSKVLELYGGFQGLNVLVDVGGGTGATLRLITSKYPHLTAINFDQPHVVADAPSHPGVEHVGGDMFVNIPKGDAIILKTILHDWNDEICLKILKNCFEALPENGKVIVIELIVPNVSKTDVSSNHVALQELMMLAHCPGSKERTQTEFEALAVESGFIGSQVICSAYNYWVMEFHKTLERWLIRVQRKRIIRLVSK